MVILVVSGLIAAESDIDFKHSWLYRATLIIFDPRFFEISTRKVENNLSSKLIRLYPSSDSIMAFIGVTHATIFSFADFDVFFWTYSFKFSNILIIIYICTKVTLHLWWKMRTENSYSKTILNSNLDYCGLYIIYTKLNHSRAYSVLYKLVWKFLSVQFEFYIFILWDRKKIFCRWLLKLPSIGSLVVVFFFLRANPWIVWIVWSIRRCLYFLRGSIFCSSCCKNVRFHHTVLKQWSERNVCPSLDYGHRLRVNEQFLDVCVCFSWLPSSSH